MPMDFSEIENNVKRLKDEISAGEASPQLSLCPVCSGASPI